MASHTPERDRLLSFWRRLRKMLALETLPAKQLPPFVWQYLRMLLATHEQEVFEAIRRGDVWWFYAWHGRLDLVDQAAIAAGMSVADRDLLIFARSVFTVLRAAAEKKLRKLGGVPPGDTK